MSANVEVVGRPSRAGTFLLRIALGGGMFIVVTFLAFSRPMPGAPRWVHELASVSFEAGMVMGLIAPVLAIIGAILCFLARRRLTALDWVSLAFGLVAGLLPAMFIYAYSNCPDGVC